MQTFQPTSDEFELFLREQEEMIRQREKEIHLIIHHIKQHEGLFFKDNGIYKEGFVHPCTKEEYTYQFTYFDKHGPIGDSCRNTHEEIAEAILDYGFQPLSINEKQLL